jgi:hypothetical protein
VGVEIHGIVEAAMQPDAPRYAGDWCLFCKARVDCVALREQAFQRAGLVFADVMAEPIAAVPAPSEMSSLDVTKALAAGELLELWITAVRQHAIDLIRQGEGVQGWKMVARKGHRKWVDEALAEKALCDAGLEARMPGKLKSPAQAEKSVKAAKAQIDLAPYITVGEGGALLVPAEDPRPAINAGVGAVFDDIAAAE